MSFSNSPKPNHTRADNTPRSSVRRQATFKQSKPTVIAVTPHRTPNDQPQPSARSRREETLVDIASTSNENAPVPNSAESESDPSYGDDAYHDDADIDTNEEFTPPPSYAEVLEDYSATGGPSKSATTATDTGTL